VEASRGEQQRKKKFGGEGKIGRGERLWGKKKEATEMNIFSNAHLPTKNRLEWEKGTGG